MSKSSQAVRVKREPESQGAVGGGHKGPNYCSLPEVPERVFDPSVNPLRASLILLSGNKWVNGTILHFYFFDQDADGEEIILRDGTTRWIPWSTTEAERVVVREAFDAWRDLGLGLQFEQVNSREDAEIRIGFMKGDGSWSYVGRDILTAGISKRTMNLGWDLTAPGEVDTPIHEIGHTLGLPHEHQNPNSGIVWNEEAVYAALAQPPNRWSRKKTFDNIIRKISPDAVQGSSWDPDSIMHYPFGSGLILQPEQYRKGLKPDAGLSNRDKAWVRAFYPPLDDAMIPELEPLESVKLAILEGQQRDFSIRPDATRYYEIRTIGLSDTVMVLFEEEGGDRRYMTADDDSGQARNAYIRVKLYKGRQYLLRVRLYYEDRAGETAVILS